ncbi:MAG: RNA 2',3'-cyclic phosphodiesterase [Planctomycetia bacterium]|jgi:2'-5' RNA ligase
MKNTVRTFIAVEIDTAVRSKASEVIQRLGRTSSEIKWVEPESMHLTLKFLGDVSLTETSRICDAVAEAVKEIKPFDMEMAGVGAFPNIHRPRTIWLGADEGTDEIVALQEAIDHGMKNLGFRLESRRFQPHLTLGRVKQLGPDVEILAEMLEAESDFGAGRTPVDQVIVFSSQLTKAGPIYSPLGTLSLGD